MIDHETPIRVRELSADPVDGHHAPRPPRGTLAGRYARFEPLDPEERRAVERFLRQRAPMFFER